MPISTGQAGVETEGRHFLVMLLDRTIVEAIKTIGYHTDSKLAAHYLFAIHFENTLANGRESGIHRHIDYLEWEETFKEHFGREATPVRAYLEISISMYEKKRKYTPSQRGKDDKFPELQVMRMSNG